MQYSQQYIENDVLNTHPVELICLLYAKAMEKLDDAGLCLENGDIAGRGRAIGHAMEILLELDSSLDFDRGGEIASRLAELYDYMLQRLTEANAEQKKEPVEEVSLLLGTLYEGWKQCRDEQPSATAFPPLPIEVEMVGSSRGWTL